MGARAESKEQRHGAVLKQEQGKWKLKLVLKQGQQERERR